MLTEPIGFSGDPGLLNKAKFYQFYQIFHQVYPDWSTAATPAASVSNEILPHRDLRTPCDPRSGHRSRTLHLHTPEEERERERLSQVLLRERLFVTSWRGGEGTES